MSTLENLEEDSPRGLKRPSLLSSISRPEKKPSPYFKKNESKIELGRESIRSMCRPDAHLSDEQQIRRVEETIRNLMRFCRSGIYAPKVNSKSVVTVSGDQKHVSTSLKKV